MGAGLGAGAVAAFTTGAAAGGGAAGAGVKGDVSFEVGGGAPGGAVAGGTGGFVLPAAGGGVAAGAEAGGGAAGGEAVVGDALGALFAGSPCASDVTVTVVTARIPATLAGTENRGDLRCIIAPQYLKKRAAGVRFVEATERANHPSARQPARATRRAGEAV